MSVIFLFVDGIGIGKEGEFNPLFNSGWDAFSQLTNGQGLHDKAVMVRNDELLYTAVDATLEVHGLPQSGTGQASLFSGENASKMIGRHFGPYPHSRTRFLLEEKSLFHKAKQKGFTPHFINAYPDIFFRKLNRKKRWTCTTLMAVSAGQQLNGVKEIRQGSAITAEIIQDIWRDQLNLDVKKITPEEAAVRLVRTLENIDLVMFEYYLTDKAGHSMNRELSLKILATLNRFLRHILTIKNNGDHLVVSSDHGNLEDLTVKTHTRNPVPLMVYGQSTEKLKTPQSIMDVPRTVLDLLGDPG